MPFISGSLGNQPKRWCLQDISRTVPGAEFHAPNQGREGPPPHGIHSASYLDRLRARDDDRGFVEDVDSHDGAVLLSPGNQNDPKQSVSPGRCEYYHHHPAGGSGCPIPGPESHPPVGLSFHIYETGFLHSSFAGNQARSCL